MPRRVMLHVGLHKSGTTFLQNVWRANRVSLADQGVHYPGGPGEPVQRMAAYDLLGRRPRRVDDQRVPGQWKALVDVITNSPHPTALISDEGLIFGTPRQAAKAVDSFADAEVHVVLTCRDLARVVVSAWQEEVKNNRTWTWPEFIEALQDPSRRGQNPSRGFWRAQDLPFILATWREVVPPERIHVVTVPPPGAPTDELLRRVGAVVGFEADLLTEEPPWDNSSLGTAGTEVVRRLNVKLDHSLNQRQHSFLVKQAIVPYLVRNGNDTKYGLPEAEFDWVHGQAVRHVEAIRAGGYDITGDLADLIPKRGKPQHSPDEFTTEELLEAAMVALQAVSERYAERWWRRRQRDKPAVEPASRGVRASSAARSVSFRSKRAAADVADRNRLVGRAMEFYLRIIDRQGKSSSN